MLKEIKKIINYFLIILATYAIFKLVNSEFFYIKKIDIIGSNTLLSEDIFDKMQYFKNKPIIYLDESELEKQLLNDIRIKKIDIKKIYPNKVEFHVTPREAKAIVDINNKYYVVDDELNVFGKFLEIDYGVLPIVYFNNDNKNIISNILKELSKSSMYKITSEIYQVGEYYNIVLDSGVKILINKNINAKKLEQAMIVYKKELDLNNSIEYIDLRFNLISVK